MLFAVSKHAILKGPEATGDGIWPRRTLFWLGPFLYRHETSLPWLLSHTVEGAGLQTLGCYGAEDHISHLCFVEQMQSLIVENGRC